MYEVSWRPAILCVLRKRVGGCDFSNTCSMNELLVFLFFIPQKVGFVIPSIHALHRFNLTIQLIKTTNENYTLCGTENETEQTEKVQQLTHTIGI